MNSRSSLGTPMIYVEDHAYRATPDKENKTKNIELDDWLLLSTHIRLIRGVLLQMKQRFTRGYKRYKETSGLIEWKECQIFHSIFT